jgi:hypothetical protein
VNPIATDFTFVELTFDDIGDPRVRKCLQELPTSFRLGRDEVDLLRRAAGHLLFNSTEFLSGMRRLDPSWQPPKHDLPPALVDKACPAAD